MHKIYVLSDLWLLCPEIQLSCIECSVNIHAKNEKLWQLIEEKCDELSSSLTTGQISKLPAITSARKAYKACGKDPARYRLSAEALLRRVVSGKGLYQINTVVDLLNLISVSTGFSIGGYDADLVEGEIEMGIGKPGEPYQGLGRGELNIEGMPVFRDNRSAFGTSTSDSERTGVSLKTNRFLMIIASYDGSTALSDATESAVHLLTKFVGADNFEFQIIRKNDETAL